MTKLLYNESFVEQLHGATLVLDTCTLIDIFKTTEVYGLFQKIQESDCVLSSISQVKGELLRPSKNRQEYDTLNRFLDEDLDLPFIPNMESRLYEDLGRDFLFVLNRCHTNRPSFVDILLLYVPIFYSTHSSDVILVTANHRDVPREIYDRIGHISYDDGKEFHQNGFYKLNRDNYQKMLMHV